MTRLIAVVDFQAGQAVHAVAGQRDRYQPYPESATTSPDPARLIAKWRSAGIEGLYVADLDALEQRPHQLSAIASWLPDDLPIWLDAGVTSTEDLVAKQAALSRQRASSVHWIVATESCASLAETPERWQPSALQAVLASGGSETIWISIDLVDGRLQSASSPGHLRERMDRWTALGLRRFVVLDLANIGTSEGPQTGPLVAELKRDYPEIEIISGGGVRDRSDVHQLADAGCDGVLVATALARTSNLGR